MAELKTKKNDQSVTAFLDKIEDGQKRQDSYKIRELMRQVSGNEPSMWGDSIIGFGVKHYENTSGGGDWPLIGFSPRKQALTLYIMTGFDDYEGLLSELGKHKTGKACLYIKKIADVDLSVLKELFEKSLQKQE